MLRKYFHNVRKTCVRANHASKGPCWCCFSCPGHFSVCQIKKFFMPSRKTSWLACNSESAFECSMRMATTLPLPKIPFSPAITVQPSRGTREKMFTETRIVIRNLEIKSTRHESNLNFSTGHGRLHNCVVGQKDKKAFEIKKVNLN